MDKNPLVSVIIPVYKVEEYLQSCVESVLAQTYRNLEIILVDDGSPDNCPAICDEYAQKDARITVIHQKNGGLSAARNTGLAHMHGEYVTFIDSDDFVHKSQIEHLLGPCLEQGAQISIGDFVRVNADTQLQEYADMDLPEPDVYYVTGREANYRFCDHMSNDRLRTIVAWGKLIRRDLLQNVRFPLGVIFEDEATSYQYLYEAEKVAYVVEAIYFYRMRPGSIINSEFSDNRFVFFDILEERTQFFLRQKNQELADMTIQSRYWEILRYYYEVTRAGKKIPERVGRLRRAMAHLYIDSLERDTISFRTKLRYFLSIPLLKTAYRRYNT